MAARRAALHIPVPPIWFNLCLAVAAVSVAAWRGGREERIAAAVIAFWVANDFIPALAWSRGWPTNVASLAIFLVLVLRSRRHWTTWAAASVLLSLVTDGLAIWPGLSRWAYLSTQNGLFYALVATVLWASLTRGPREARTTP